MPLNIPYSRDGKQCMSNILDLLVHNILAIYYILDIFSGVPELASMQWYVRSNKPSYKAKQSGLGHPTHVGPFERCTVVVARRLGSGGRVAVFVHPYAGWSLWYPWCMLHREDTDWVDGAASSDGEGVAGPH